MFQKASIMTVLWEFIHSGHIVAMNLLGNQAGSEHKLKGILGGTGLFLGDYCHHPVCQ